MADRQWKRFEVGLTAEVGSGVSALDWADGEGGGEGGGGGDGGGGDPVEQEPALPVLVQAQLLLLRVHLDILPGRLNCILRLVSIQGDRPPLPAGARGDGGGRHVADGGRLQRRGGGARAHEEQLRLPHHLVRQPFNYF